MSNNVKLLYIDDEIDNLLTTYLESVCDSTREHKGIPLNLEYEEHEFHTDSKYDDFLNSKPLRTADIIIIDSRLFRNDNSKYHYRGEEIELLIRQVFPFKEVIIITQNEMDNEYDVVRKYESKSEDDEEKAFNYYKEGLLPIVLMKAKTIVSRRTSAEEFNQNSTWGGVVKEKMIYSLNSLSHYEELTKSDIDQLIRSFQKLEEQLKEHK